MLKLNAAPIIAFLLQLRGRRGTFALGDQDRKTIQGVATGTIRVNGEEDTATVLTKANLCVCTPTFVGNVNGYDGVNTAIIILRMLLQIYHLLI